MMLVAARGGRVMLTAATGGQIPSIYWGPKVTLSHVWLGRFTTDGALVRSWTWGTKKKDAAEPLAIAIDAKRRTWVVGNQRDPSDGGLDAFVTTFDAGGHRIGNLHIGDTKFVQGSGVAAEWSAYATGFTSTKGGDWKAGHVWRLVP